MANEKELMTIDEVAAYYRCSKRTLYQWLHDGKIAGVKVGRRWLFDRAEIQRLPR